MRTKQYLNIYTETVDMGVGVPTLTPFTPSEELLAKVGENLEGIYTKAQFRKMVALIKIKEEFTFEAGEPVSIKFVALRPVDALTATIVEQLVIA